MTSVWARGEITDTDRYVDTVAPLADDPAVQQAVATNMTNRVFEYIDVQGLTSQAFAALAQQGALPPALAAQLQALAVPLSNGVRSFAEDQVLNLVQSDVFADAWEEANRAAHEQIVAALTGESSAVTIENDAVTVNLAPFLAEVKERLVARGFGLAERIPAVNAEFVVFRSSDLTTVQNGYRLVDALGMWLPFICVALAALGIFVARNHRLAFLGAGLGLAAAMVVTGIALALARRAYLDGVPPDVLPAEAATAIFDTLVRFLRDSLRAAFLIGLLTALVAFLSGPSVTAVTFRRWATAGLAYAKGGIEALGLDLTRPTGWVAPQARVLRAAVFVVGFVVLLVERYRTPDLVLWVEAGVLLGITVVQFLATEPRQVSRPARAPQEVGTVPEPAPA